MSITKLQSLTTSQLVSLVRKQKLILKAQWVIISFALIVGIILPLLIKIKARKFEPKFLPVKVEEANPGIGSYRKNFAYQRLSLTSAPKVSGIVHEFSDIEAYITFFKNFVSSHNVLKDCEWRVGFYPAIYELPDGRPRLGIYVIPTMFDTTAVGVKAQVKDYFDLVENDATTKEYTNYYLKDKNGAPVDYFIYDQGTIFP